MITPTNEEIRQSREMIGKITEGLNQSSIAAALEAKLHNSKIICWQDGKIVEIDPNEIDLDE